jgi:hypothetical protein
LTKPEGLVPVAAAITVEIEGAVLSTTTLNVAGELALLTTSVAVTAKLFEPSLSGLLAISVALLKR